MKSSFYGPRRFMRPKFLKQNYYITTTRSCDIANYLPMATGEPPPAISLAWEIHSAFVLGVSPQLLVLSQPAQEQGLQVQSEKQQEDLISFIISPVGMVPPWHSTLVMASGHASHSAKLTQNLMPRTWIAIVEGAIVDGNRKGVGMIVLYHEQHSSGIYI